MRFVFISLIFNLVVLAAAAQTVVRKGSLDPRLSESSGLQKANNNSFWTHNDGGNKPEIFLVDTLGNVLRTLTVSNFSNLDWEDLAMDQEGNLYIGDFGNNDHVRTDLKIGVVGVNELNKDTVYVSVIQFRFEDQTEFPPGNDKKNFDCESMFIFGDSIYLLSKNWTVPFDGICKMYVLPKDTGIWVASAVDSVKIGSTSLLDQVTSADIISHKLALLGANEIHTFSFSNVPRFENRMDISLGSISQKEGLTWYNDSLLYFTEERFVTDPGLYQVAIKSPTSGVEKLSNHLCTIKNQKDEIIIRCLDNMTTRVALFDSWGRLHKQDWFGPESSEICISTLDLSHGIYFLELRTTKNIELIKLLL